MADLDITAQVIDKTAPGLKRVNGNVSNVSKRLKQLGKAAKIAAIAVGAIAIGGIAVTAKLLSGFLATNDVIGKMSTRLGVNAERLQRWNFVAKQTGAEATDVGDAVGDLQKVIGGAAAGAQGNIDTLEKLGLTYSDLEGLRPGAQFEIVRTALSKVEDQSKQTTLGNALLGGAYKKLAPLVKLTNDEFRALQHTAPNVVSEETIRASEQLNDTIDRMKQQFQALLTQGLSKVIPVITRFIEWVKAVAVPTFKRDFQPAIVSLIQVFRALVDQGLARVIPVITSFIEWIRTVAVPVFRKDFQPTIVVVIDVIDRLIRKANELGVFRVIMKVVTLVVQTAVKLVVIRLKTLIDVLRGLSTFIRGVFTGDWQLAWEGIKQIFEAAWTAIKSTASLALDFLRSTFKVFGVDLNKTFKAVVNGIIGSFEAIPNSFIDALNAVTSAWNNFSINIPPLVVLGKTVIPGINFNTPNIPTVPRVRIPRLGAGGIVRRPTIALLGEEGPERVEPLGKGGGGNIYININIDNNLEGTAELERVILRTTNKALRQRQLLVG